VIPTPVQLEEISLLREGKLPEIPFSALLLAYAIHRRTLLLEVRRKQIAKQIVLENGIPVDCRSNLVHETLSRYLVSQGKLPAESLHAYLNESAAHDRPFGEVLLDHGVLGAEELFKSLQQNLAKKLLDVFAWRDGRFRWLPDAPPPQSPLKIRVPQLIVTGITKCAPQEEVNAAVAPLVGKQLTLQPTLAFSLDELRFTARQAKVVGALRSGSRMDELALSTGLPFEEISRLLYALALLGLVLPSRLPSRRLSATGAIRVDPSWLPPETSDAGRTPPPAAAGGMEPARAAAPGNASRPAPSAAGPPAKDQAGPAAERDQAGGAPAAESPGAALAAAGSAGAPAAGDSAEQRRNEVMQAYLSYRRLDAFDLLGLDEEASPAAVQHKFVDFARRYAPWTLAGPELAGMEEMASDLFLAGARAYAELADLDQRNTLLLRRKTLREERRQRPQIAIKTDLLDPEVQYRKGRTLMTAGKYAEAVLLLEFASDCDPQNGLYSAELAYCRFCLAPGNAEQALQELQETLRRDPDCGLAMYYSGEIHRQIGESDAAAAELRRAIKMMSPDRRPIEALKALAAERKR
jgi:Domain of unknown function (DUF4388)/Tetratricopeptide repeat